MIVNPGIRRFLGSAIQRLFNSASVSLPLTHTAIPTRGSVTPAFTRATTETGQKWDEAGYLDFTALAGEMVFKGARRERNKFTFTEDLTNAAYTATRLTKTNSTTLTETAVLGSHFVVQNGADTYVAGNTYVLSCKVKFTGRSGWIAFGSGNAGSSVACIRTFNPALGTFGSFTSDVGMTFVSKGIDAVDSNGFARISITFIPTGTTAGGGFQLYTDASTDGSGTLSFTGDVDVSIQCKEFQLEDVTGQTTQTASEYVSVGVESAPAYHGSMVDGVKCYDTDRSGNPITTTTTYDAVTLNGVAGTYVSTPDSVAASITGDIDIRVKAALTDWTPAAIVTLVSKWDSGSTKSYMLNVEPGGTLSAFMSPDGSATNNDVYSTTATGFSDGTAHWCRVVRVAATGEVTFYTSSDGDSWTQLGTPVAGVAGDIFDSTAIVEIGSLVGGVANNASGKIYAAQIYNGIDGTLAVDFDASRYAGGTTLTGSTGETWTLQGNAVIHPTNYPLVGYVPWEARTNLCLQSNAYNTAPWSNAFGTVAFTQNATGPDGATSAWTGVDSDGAVASYGAQSMTLTAANWTQRILVKKTTGVQATYPCFGAYRGSTDIALCTVDTSNGIATVWTAYTGLTVSTSSARCNSYNALFWEVELTLLGTAAVWTQCLMKVPAGTSNPTQSTGILDGTLQGSAVFYGGTMELGSFATPYIPTTTVAVARNADLLTYTGADVANIKTLAATFSRGVGVATPGAVVALTDGTANERHTMIFNNATQFFIVGSDGGVNRYLMQPTYTPGTTSKAAVTFATNDVKADFNGTAQTPDTAATMPTVTQINVGHEAGIAVGNCAVNHIYGWTRNLSQSELGAVDR